MANTNNFIITTDYGALGNDGTGDATSTVPSGFVLPAGGGLFGTPSESYWDTIINIGKTDSQPLFRMQYSLEIGKWYTRRFTKTLASDASGQIILEASVQKLSGNQVRCRVGVFNYYAGTVTTGTSWTVSFHALTFKRV